MKRDVASLLGTDGSFYGQCDTSFLGIGRIFDAYLILREHLRRQIMQPSSCHLVAAFDSSRTTFPCFYTDKSQKSVTCIGIFNDEV